MTSDVLVHGLAERRRFVAGILILVALGVAGVAPSAMAKDIPLLAIEVYDGPSGAAYVQLTDVLINGKIEMKDCTPFQNAAVDKSTYGKMGKVVMGVGGVLERGADGVMRYTPSGGSAACVVPVNIKFDHNAAYSLSELADQAMLHGTPLGTVTDAAAGAPPIKKTVKLVFVSAPNPESGEYMRAERATDIPGWQAYLSKYPAVAHSADAKLRLAALFVSAGEAAWQSYDKSAGTASPRYADLKTAKSNLDQAHAVAPDIPSVKSLADELHKSFTGITDKGRAELDNYHVALNGHTAGYVHLQNAKKLSDIVAGIDPYFAPEQALMGDVQKDINDEEAAVQSANGAVDGKQFDQAYAFLVPYRAFADEEPRVGVVVDATYQYHMEQGGAKGGTQNWPGAIKEYQQAIKTKDTPEAQDAEKNAEAQLVIVTDNNAVARAIESSKDYQQQKKPIPAYEVLSSLTPHQQGMAVEEMKALQAGYVVAAAAEAKSLHQAHTPIRGPSDMAAIEKAYIYLKNAYELSQDESYKDKMDSYGDDLSAYLLDQAKTYLAKPVGSGTELGFACLEEARKYRASNFDAVRDAITSAGPAHAMRSKLSIRVQFRDPTTQADRAGFATQLESAIITGLEDSGVVKVVRVGETTAVEPDFQLDGDVLTHRFTAVPTKEPLESSYRAGVEQVPNEAWNALNRDIDKAKNELMTAQLALQGAEARGNKKSIKDLNAAKDDAEKTIADLSTKLDTIPKTRPQDEIRKYNYTKLTTDLDGTIKLQFRIADALTGQTTKTDPIERPAHQQDVQLLEVRGDDVDGIKNSGVDSKPEEFRSNLENAVRDELVAKVKEKVAELPLKMYGIAKAREAEDDLEGAGELYRRFLEITQDDKSVERTHASEFLKDNFNLRPQVIATQ
jgi:hypothetical protein